MCLQSENWLIGGVTRSRALVGLFLREEIAPHHGIDHLPLAPDVEAYLDEMEAGPWIREFGNVGPRRPTPTRVRTIGSETRFGSSSWTGRGTSTTAPRICGAESDRRNLGL